MGQRDRLGEGLVEAERPGEERATWVTCSVCVSRVTKWSPSGFRKTWVLCLSRRNALACRMRSRIPLERGPQRVLGLGTHAPRLAAARDRRRGQLLLGAFAGRPVDAVERPAGHPQSPSATPSSASTASHTMRGASSSASGTAGEGPGRPASTARSRPGCRGRRPAARAGPAARARRARRRPAPPPAARWPAAPPPRPGDRPSRHGRCGSGRTAAPGGWPSGRRPRRGASRRTPGCRGSCSSSRRPGRSSPRARTPGRTAWWR